jgi:dipeptidyl aminopeptidase/acylaminoacyl peptidase
VRFDVDRDAPVAEPLVRGGAVHAPKLGGDGQVYFAYDTLLEPPEIARCPPAGGAVERVTRFNDALLREVDLGKVEERELEGAAGDRVQMFVLRPPGFTPDRRWPLVHLIHGGPHGMFGDVWHFRWNAPTFAAAGYVVAMVNFHGSSSCGEAFTRAVDGEWGGGAATDILLATDALVAEGTVDPARMAIAGGSYGGYMTCWLATQTDRFACAVTHAPVYDIASLWAGDVTQGTELEIGGRPWGSAEERAAIERYNPPAFADRYKTPMLVIHGEKDYLKARGIEARLVYYPDENHWVLKPQNSLHWYGEVLGWLKRHLG